MQFKNMHATVKNKGAVFPRSCTAQLAQLAQHRCLLRLAHCQERRPLPAAPRPLPGAQHRCLLRLAYWQQRSTAACCASFTGCSAAPLPAAPRLLAAAQHSCLLRLVHCQERSTAACCASFTGCSAAPLPACGAAPLPAAPRPLPGAPSLAHVGLNLLTTNVF